MTTRKTNGVPTQRDISRRLDLDVSTVNKILRGAPGPNKNTARRVWEMAEAIGYDLERLRHLHQRKDERRFGNRSVVVSVYDHDGGLIDRGSAKLVELSRWGARLDHLRLPGKSLPLRGYAIGIRILEEKSLERRARLVRVIELRAGDSIAVRFESPLGPAFLSSLLDFRS